MERAQRHPPSGRGHPRSHRTDPSRGPRRGHPTGRRHLRSLQRRAARCRSTGPMYPGQGRTTPPRQSVPGRGHPGSDDIGENPARKVQRRRRETGAGEQRRRGDLPCSLAPLLLCTHQRQTAVTLRRGGENVLLGCQIGVWRCQTPTGGLSKSYLEKNY